MGALNKRRNFTLDQAWEVSDRTIVALEAVLGIPIGSDDGSVLYIQDVGVKELGYGYIDKITKKIYRCIVRTEEIVNSGTYFEDVSNNTMSDKLNNLFDYRTVTVKFDVPGTWYTIPYPNGSDSSNTIVIPVAVGTTATNFYDIKINVNHTYYCATNIVGSSTDFMIRFIFIRK